MISESRVKIWVHTCAPRLDKLGPTIQSLDESDAKGKYEILECPAGKLDAANEWWAETMLRLASEEPEGEGPHCIVRLEDDVIVNHHLLHNVCSWPALGFADFGMGLIFNWDGQWPPRAMSQRWTKMPHGQRDIRELQRLDLDLGGAQGQVFRADFIPKLVSQISNAQRKCGKGHLIFDWVLTRATRYAGRAVYSHLPSLVNGHIGSTMGATGMSHNGHFSHKTYDANWKAGVDPRPSKVYCRG